MGDRLSAVDAAFLGFERGPAHMHVGACMLFSGTAPGYREFVHHLESRLHLLPRLRQRLAFPPFGQGLPEWVDDPYFYIDYHVRHVNLPAPAGVPHLRRLAGKIFSQKLDRSRPLWELWLVDNVNLGVRDSGYGESHFALIAKAHHCLVDGAAGLGIMEGLLDPEPFGAEGKGGAAPAKKSLRGSNWQPAPLPGRSELLVSAVGERINEAGQLAKFAANAVTHPTKTISTAARMGTRLVVDLRKRPRVSPLNVKIGPHRRLTWLHLKQAELEKLAKSLDGTLNDVVLAVVAGAVREHCLNNGHDVDELQVGTLMPASLRSAGDKRAGNRVTPLFLSLPVNEADPLERFDLVRDATIGLKGSGRIADGVNLHRLAQVTPQPLVTHYARKSLDSQGINLTVTNVQGPDHPLYLLGRPLDHVYPQIPLTSHNPLGFAVISYNGNIHIGITADYDAVPDVNTLISAVRDSIAELTLAVGGAVEKPMLTA